MRFNRRRPGVMKRMKEGREIQRRMMSRMTNVLKAIFMYGGHVMIENPRYSEFWDQDFVKEWDDILPTGHAWRNIELDMCRVGSPYKKPTRFRTTAPEPATIHMERKCDHEGSHERLSGRDKVTGRPKTAATAAYTAQLVRMLVFVAAILAGMSMVYSDHGFKAGDGSTSMEQVYATEGSEHWETRDPPQSMDEWLHDDWTHDDNNECYLAQAKLRLYWDRVKSLPKKNASTAADISIHEDCPNEVKERVQAAVDKYQGVFNDGAAGMPRRAKGETVTIKLKDDAKPQRCPEPTWGHGAKRDVLTKWAKEKLATGEFIHCPESQWASRPHIALKPKRGSAKDADDFDVRVCGDYVYLNSQTKSLQANAPNVPYQLEKAAGKRRYWYTDQDRQYNQWELSDESSKVCAMWTPLGLLRPTRLQFGLKNAGVIAQGAVRVGREVHLGEYTKDHSINVADDFNGFCDTEIIEGKSYDDWNGLATSFIEHLEMAEKEHWSFKGSKTFFGFPESQFFWYVLNKHGMRAATHNLTPIEQMVAPSDVSGLRRVLGLLNVHHKAIPKYKQIARPLYDLTGKVDWHWGPKEDAAFERLRVLALSNGILSAPDFTKQVVVESDASDFGKGWVIYQLRDPLGDEDDPDNRAVLKYGSKAWSNSMQGKPPYYAEADALITAAADAKYYATATPFPLKVKSDQAPLRYIKTCAKGPVTAWRIENLSDCDYEVEYYPGAKNIYADALSRPPM